MGRHRLRQHGTALVTGASSGIGRDLAWVFAERGFDVVLVARSEQTLQELATKIGAATGRRTHVICADLGNPEGPTSVDAELRERGIEVDVLVNNAGLGLIGPFAEMDEQAIESMLSVNMLALVRLTRLLLPGMVARGSGGVLNVSSVSGFQPGPLMAVYHATKAFVVSFSRALGSELADTGVNVTTLCPGTTKTAFLERAEVSEGVRSSRMLDLVMLGSRRVAEAGYAGVVRGAPVVIPGAHFKAIAWTSRVFPQRLVTRIAKRTLRGAAGH